MAKQNDIKNQLKHLENQIENLEKQRTGIIENELPLMDGAVIQLVKGKTSGVTGGAVVKIKKDDERKQYMLKNIFDAEKTYKNVFRQEKQHSGKHYYDPNCKSETRSFLTRHTLKEVNTSVIQEFIALRLANVVSPGIAPGAILGTINDGNGKTRYCLLTEMAGQNDGEKFSTLDATANIDTAKPYGVGKDVWKSFFAIGIGLLNDKDVAKKDNIGVVTKGSDQGANLSLFDLGHASPDEFKLDPETLLPKSKSRLADFVLWLINLFVPANSITGTFYFDKDIQGILTIDERKEALQNLLSHKDDIMGELEKIKKDIPEYDGKIVDDMKRRIKARFNQLRDVLEAHSKINATKTRKNENNVSHSSKQEEVGEVAESRQALKQELGGLMEKSQSQSSNQNVEGKTTKLNKSSKRKKGNKTTDVSRSSSKRNVEGQTTKLNKSSNRKKGDKTTDVNQALVQELKERQKEIGSQSFEQNGGGEAVDVDITIEEIPD